jgi:hypothetical protein
MMSLRTKLLQQVAAVLKKPSLKAEKRSSLLMLGIFTLLILSRRASTGET